MTEPAPEVVQLISDMWDRNQELQDQLRALEAAKLAVEIELLGLQKRFEHWSLGVGQVGLLVDIAKKVVAVRDKGTEAAPADLADAFALVAVWEHNNRKGDR